MLRGRGHDKVKSKKCGLSPIGGPREMRTWLNLQHLQNAGEMVGWVCAVVLVGKGGGG